jgi:hypothetical protein
MATRSNSKKSNSAKSASTSDAVNSNQRMDRVASISLEGSTNSNDLWSHHKSVENYYQDMNIKKQEAFDFLRDRQWNDEELARFRQLGKVPVVMNNLHASERTITGLFIQNKYDVKFSPFEPNDQEISDVLNTLYIHTENAQKWGFKDIEMIRQAWACGVAYMEVYMDVQPGEEPVMCTNMLNPFAVWFDPESRDLICREDALFVDRSTWVTPETLHDKFDIPMDEALSLVDDKVQLPTDSSMTGNSLSTSSPSTGMNGSTVYRDSAIYRDVSHLTLDRKNGRILVVERFYKVFKKFYYIIDADMNRIEVKREAKGELEALGQQMFSGKREELYYACMAPALSTGKYLYNDAYHCSPTDVASKKIIWPILEMVAESLNGDPSGFVLPQVGANKVINSVMSTIVHSAKNAVSTSYLRQKGAFDDQTARNFDKNHSNADAVFPVEQDFPLSQAVAPVPKGDAGASQDNYQALQIANQFQDKVSSTPPSIQGISENASTSGVLNAQRIEQAFVQLQGLISNWKMFLKRRASLVQYYWRTYWTYEKIIRITGDQAKTQDQYVTLNQTQPEVDEMGQETGEIRKVNDISKAEYDVVIDDSYRSATYREKTQQYLAQLMTMPGINSDPILLGALALEFARVSDLSEDLKEALKANSTVAKQMAEFKAQQEQQAHQQAQQGANIKNQGAQINNAQAMQAMAQTEAEQTGNGMPMQNLSRQPQPQMAPA